MKTVKILGFPKEIPHVEIGKGQEKDYFVINARQFTEKGKLEDGSEVEYKSFLSLWQFDKEELLTLLKTGRIWYSRMCFNAPFQPMNLFVENPTGNKQDDITIQNPLAPELIRLLDRFTTFRTASPMMHDMADGKSEEIWLEMGKLFAKSPEYKESDRGQLAQIFREIAFNALRLAEIHEAKKHF